MRTYSKRHARAQNVLNNVVVNNQTSRKRVRNSTEGHSRKRTKLVDRPAMSGTFETPHPTLEASSQVYKLPSTKPIPSPTPFSPVPITAPARSMDKRSRPKFLPTTSGGFKENTESSKSIRRRHSSKALSSSTLTRLASRNIREDCKQSRSPSRSSNSASSGSRSRDQARLSKSRKSKLIKKSKLRPSAAINDLGDRHSSNSKLTPFTGSKSFPKNVLLLSDSKKNLLGSPFASRAPSPTAIVKSDLSESLGPPADPQLLPHHRGPSKSFVDLSVRPHSRTLNQFQSKEGRNSQASDAFSSPEKAGTRKRSNRGSGRTTENNFSWKYRRPSAPSDLQRPPKPVGKAHIPAKRAEKASSKRLKEDIEISWRTNELQKPVPSQLDDLIKDCDNSMSVGLIDNPDPFSWMQERSAVDFNRPPSQMSYRLSSGFGHVEDDGEEGVFWSSGDDDDDTQQPLGAKLEATNSAWHSSTPYKTVLARRPSVPILEGSNIALPGPRDFGKARSMSMSASRKAGHSTVGDKDKSGEDMELTAPLECGNSRENYQTDSISLQEHTPWITDSIISPPTAYSPIRKPVGNVENKAIDEKLEEEQPVPAESGFQIPTSPSLSVARMQTGIRFSSYAESTSSVAESGSIGSDDPMTRGQNEEDTVAERKGAAVQSQGPQRTRSGTILASRNGAPIAKRTRTGTIVGPSAIGRTRSGTIVAKVKIPEQSVAVCGNSRTRSSPVPDPSVSGKKGVRLSSGSVTKLEPTKISDLAGAEEDVQAKEDGGFAQIENISNQRASDIQDVKNAFYVDSLYRPSSPDPINFLTGANIDGDDSALVVAVGEWQVVDEPPSPEIKRTKKTIQTPRAVGGRSTRRFKVKGNRKNRARFLGADGQVEGYESDDPRGNKVNFEDGLSDDELLLVEGQSQSLFS